MGQSKRDVLNNRYAQLKQERSGFRSLWKDVRDYILPDSGEFKGEQSLRKGGKRWDKIVDAEATMSLRLLASGLMGGVSPSNNAWVHLTTNDPELDEDYDVKKWLSDVTELMLMTFARAGVYNPLHQSYLEMPAFGTSCTLSLPHPDQVLYCRNLTVGTYYLGDDQYGTVDTMYNEMSVTTKQLIEMFGYNKCPKIIQNLWDQKRWFDRIDVVHAIEPRMERDETKRDSMNMAFRSVYFIPDENHILNESGFPHFPVMAPRWEVSAGSVYGRGIGMMALGTAKRIQQYSRDVAVASAWESNPAWVIPSSLDGMEDRIVPGGYVPANPQEAVVLKQLLERPPTGQQAMAMLMQAKQDIQKYFYNHLFQLISQTSLASSKDQTATEVLALEQEKMMMLGPVLERLHKEKLDPLVTSCFNYLLEADLLPPIPDGLQGKQLNVEYTSSMAQEQRASALGSVNKFVTNIGMLMQVSPDVVDNWDIDKTVQFMADRMGVPPDLIRSSKQVALIREDRQEQQQAIMQAEMEQKRAQAVRDTASGVQAAAQAEATAMQAQRGGEGA